MSDLRKAAQSAIDAYERLIPTLPGLKDSGNRWLRESLIKATDDLRAALAESTVKPDLTDREPLKWSDRMTFDKPPECYRNPPLFTVHVRQNDDGSFYEVKE